MLTLTLLLLLAAFVCTIVVAIGRCPGWVPVLLLCVLEAVQVLPR